MAVWLSMSMSYVGVGDSANTSKIIVSVDVSWDYPHFNRDGGTLKVTVDGVTDTRIVPFNAGETSSGSQNIYSYYWNIAQHDGAAKTVSASATFQATSSTAATPASTTLSLPAIGDSSGGGDSGGDSGNDDEPDEEGRYTVTLAAGAHTKIRFYYFGITEIKNSDAIKMYSGEYFTITVEVDDGYVLSSCTINGREWDTAKQYTVTSNVTVTTAAKLAQAIDKWIANIDSSAGFHSYRICIDNGTTWDEYGANIDNGTSWDLNG